MPLLVGDYVEDDNLGHVYRDFFDKFKPCINWDCVPDKCIHGIQKRAVHMLSKEPELKMSIESRKVKVPKEPGKRAL